MLLEERKTALGSALLCSGAMCTELLPFRGVPGTWDPGAAGGTRRRDVAAFPKSGMQGQPPEWEFMVKVPSAVDGVSCLARVGKNELLPLERHLLLSGESQQRVINHRAGQSCLLHAGHGFSARAGGGFAVLLSPSALGQPGRPSGGCCMGVQAR